MSRGRPGRERRPHALFEAHAPDARTQKCGSHASADDASFARSSDPCTLIATSTPSGQLAEVARRSRYRGRVNLVMSQEEPAPGSESADVARLAACHRFRKGEGVAGRRKGRASRCPSLRGSRELRAQCPYVVVVAEIGRRRPAPNTLGIRAPKSAVRVERTGA
jgi:hypothetical protein